MEYILCTKELNSNSDLLSENHLNTCNTAHHTNLHVLLPTAWACHCHCKLIPLACVMSQTQVRIFTMFVLVYKGYILIVPLKTTEIHVCLFHLKNTFLYTVSEKLWWIGTWEGQIKVKWEFSNLFDYSSHPHITRIYISYSRWKKNITFTGLRKLGQSWPVLTIPL